MLLTKIQIMDHIKESCDRLEKKPSLDDAIFMASYTLMEATDKSGTDYSNHWVNVAFNGTNSDVKKQTGVLHDVIEDSIDFMPHDPWTLDDLRKLGFDNRVVDGVDGMTRREEAGESYCEFVERCSLNPLSLDVKLKDLEHNLSQSRNNFIPGAHDLMRIQKYIVSYQYLVAVKKGKIEAGSPMEDFASTFFAKDKNYDLLRPVFEKEGRILPPKPLTPKFGGLTPA